MSCVPFCMLFPPQRALAPDILLLSRDPMVLPAHSSTQCVRGALLCKTCVCELVFGVAPADMQGEIEFEFLSAGWFEWTGQ
jgi:hypothetical protein